jgi:hypothetical protein
MSTLAQRRRSFRQRQRRGRIVIRLEVNEFEIAAALLASRHLAESEAANRAALERGVEAVLSGWARQWLKKP